MGDLPRARARPPCGVEKIGWRCERFRGNPPMPRLKTRTDLTPHHGFPLAVRAFRLASRWCHVGQALSLRLLMGSRSPRVGLRCRWWSSQEHDRSVHVGPVRGRSRPGPAARSDAALHGYAVARCQPREVGYPARSGVAPLTRREAVKCLTTRGGGLTRRADKCRYVDVIERRTGVLDRGVNRGVH